MNDLFYVKNKFYILEYKDDTKLKDNETLMTYNECLKIVDDNLYKNDLSKDITEINYKFNNNNLIFNKLKKSVKVYSFNIIQYKPQFSDFTFNIGVVVWNKESKECCVKFIDDDFINSLSKIMNVEFIKVIKDHFLKNVFTLDLSILDIKKNIIHNSISHLEYSFKFDNWNYWNQYENYDIRLALEDIYKSYIGFIIK